MTRRRHRSRKRIRRAPPGAPPGLLISDPEAPHPQLKIFGYGPDGYDEREIKDPAEIAAFRTRWPVTWLDVQGLGDAAIIERVGQVFGLHSLWLEDVLNAHQRPKVENYGDVRFLVVRTLEGEDEPETDQMSIFLGPAFVVTFQERPGDCFEPLRTRIRHGKGRVRTSGPDYLAYSLLDAVVDNYFPVLERLGERIDALEDDLVLAPDPARLTEIHLVRRGLLTLRRAVWPLREALQHLLRDGDVVFKPETRPYLNDCYDHTVQIMDLVENYREIASGLIDIYLSSMTQRMNEVMKVLTIISTIFIPLTFIAGVYGMNFDPDAGPLSMPELRTPYGYILTLIGMAVIALGLVWWFWRKGWIFAKHHHHEIPPRP